MEISQNFTTGSTPKVFIIVLHYKNWKDTNECLSSLDKLDYPSTGSGQGFEIIVIDNDKENKGFAGGNNIGIKQALKKDADYILLLNNDTIVEPDFLKGLIKAGESDKEAGILGPVIYEYPSNKIHFTGGKINWLYTKGTHVQGTRNNPPAGEAGKQETKETDYVTGCCMLIKREVIDKIGLMSEDYFLYYEDVDWCLRARKAGFKCIIVSTAKIWHKVSQGLSEASFSYIYYHFRNGLLLSKQNATFFIKIIAYFISFLVYFKQLIKSPSKWTKAIKLGIRDFYKGNFGELK